MNPFKKSSKSNSPVDYEKLYLDINHKYVHLKKELPHLKKQHITQFPTGHFYSPFVDLKEIDKRKKQIFNRSKQPIAGIDIDEKGQLALLEKISKFYDELPYKTLSSKTDLRYFFDNNAYSYTDAIVLYSMLRHLQPKRVIEIGSGYSSALMLDVNERFKGGKMDLTFVEPYPKLLLSLIRKTDKYTLLDKPLYEVPIKTFENLQSGDILFVDSTHVSKAGSDVNQIFFEILPALKKGVIIHIHDIFYPFEYPHEWLAETRAWNEDYLVRAFLHNNKEYEILLFNNFLNLHHKDSLKKLMPLTLKNSGGSLWLQKV